MAINTKGTTYATGNQVGATGLNNLVDASTFDTPADESTIRKNGSGVLEMKDGGTTPAKLSAGAPSWDSGGITTLTASDNSNYTATITNNGGQGLGLSVVAGSSGNASAVPLLVSDQVNTILKVQGDGKIGINETSPDYTLDVDGDFGFTPGTSVTPTDNGDVVIEATNNTTLTFKLKGSDGTVRSGTLTLS